MSKTKHRTNANAQFYVGNVYLQKKIVHLVNRPLSDLESEAIETNSDFVVLGAKPKVSHRLGRHSTTQLYL